MRLIDEQFLETPWYGSRQMARHLRRNGWCVGRHRVRRLMTKMGLAPIYQRSEDQRAAPAAQDLSVSAAASDDRSAEPSLVRRRDLHPDAARLPLPRRDHGLGEPQGPGLAAVEHDGCRVLRCGAGGGHRPLRQARHLQHRSGLAVHQLRLHQHAEGRRHPHLDGWPWPLDGQRLHRAAVAIAQIRMRVPQCLRDRQRGTSRRSVVGSHTTTPIDRTRRSAAGRPTRSMLRRQARRNWRRNQTQNPP